MKYCYFLILIILLSSCKTETKSLTAQEIIDKSILASGTQQVENSEISFEFRNNKYKAVRTNGIYKLYRTYTKDSIVINDVLTNYGYTRRENDILVTVPDSMKVIYSNSINSVHYFSVLPYGLNDKAVKKRLLNSSSVKGVDYYKIEITFSENGGGEDFEDVFIYWVRKDNFLIDYLAYAYQTNGGGKRFRELKEQCIKNGIRFVDYINHKPLEKNTKLVDLDKAYENDKLEKVSEIVLEDIRVSF